jgi:hypothetical protein
MAEKDEGEAGRSLNEDENNERGEEEDVKNVERSGGGGGGGSGGGGWTWLNRGDETAFPVT